MCGTNSGASVRYSWDPRKAASNLKQHVGVSFDEAVSVCEDELSVWSSDWEQGELRHNVVGYSQRSRVLFVVVVEWEEGTLRIISARKATKYERKNFEER